MDHVEAGPVDDIAAIEAALDELAQVGSAARHADQLAAVIVDAHAAGFRRLVELAENPSVLTADPGLAELFWLHQAAGDGAAIDTMGTRVDTLRASIEQCGVPGLLNAADRLVESLSGMYGWALGRAVEVLHGSGQSATLSAALDDTLIGALLLSHGMHPDPLARRVAHVLAACATSLGGHAGNIELLEASDSDGTVRIKLSGGDEKQRWRTRLTVERAIRELVADVVTLDVEGAEAEPRGTPGPTIIPVASIGRRRTSRWAEAPGLADLADGAVTQVAVDGVALIACRIGADWFVTPSPFTTNSLRLIATDPPTVESSDGVRVEFTNPLRTHVDNGIFEIALP